MSHFVIKKPLWVLHPVAGGTGHRRDLGVTLLEVGLEGLDRGIAAGAVGAVDGHGGQGGAALVTPHRGVGWGTAGAKGGFGSGGGGGRRVGQES